MNNQKRPWHELYEMLSGSAEIQMLKLLEPAEFLPEDDWAVKVRQQFPTVPPSGIEMCHQNWLVGLDILLDSIANEQYQRENFWCGDIPLEIISGLGLRRRILKFWLKNVPQNEVEQLFASTAGESPFITAIYYRILGDFKHALYEIKADIQDIVDILIGPFVHGTEALAAKWRQLNEAQKKRNSILMNIEPTIMTNLCNFRSLNNVDTLVNMISKQKFDDELLGGCNESLKFIMQEAPEVLLASEAIVWASYIFVASELGNKTINPPEIIKDQCLAIHDKLGGATKIKGWLVCSLGLLVKAWLKRAWAFIGVKVERSKLPDFVFEIPDSLIHKATKSSKAPKISPSEKEPIQAKSEGNNQPIKTLVSSLELNSPNYSKITKIDEQEKTSSELISENAPALLSLEELEKLVAKEDDHFDENTITGRMTGCWTKDKISKRLQVLNPDKIEQSEKLTADDDNNPKNIDKDELELDDDSKQIDETKS